MTLAPIESPSRTANSAKVDLPEPSGNPSDRPANGEFGQIMSGVLQSSTETSPLPAGQEMAAVSELQAAWPGSFGGNLGASLGGDLLKAVHLGPNMNVITSEAAVPDEQSLEAFARSQGLDETAVQWLMGSNPVVAAPPPMTVTVGLGTLDSVASVNAINASSQTGGANPLKPVDVSGPAVVAGLESTSLGNTTFLGNTSSLGIHMPTENPTASGSPLPINAINTPTPALAELGLPSPAPLGQSPAVTPVTMPNADPMVGDSNPNVLLSPQALTAAALWAMAQGTEKAQVTRPAQEDPAEVAKVQINLMASPAPAAFWMLRNPMVAAPAKEAVVTPSGASVSEIDLSQIATPELLDNLNQTLAEGSGLSTTTAGNDHPTPLSGHAAHRVDLAAAARQDAQNPDASASAPDSGNAQRSEKIQNLAEKMGQAVGQRILSEIEKGQWHLKLSLRPATLGHIEVEMRMRSGELDAIFTAPQALTRELLQEGMSKLKDTLSQMGMDVASVQVGDGQTQKRGGESTPGQMSKSANDSSDDTQSSLSAVQAPNTRMKMGQDGWDVLV